MLVWEKLAFNVKNSSMVFEPCSRPVLLLVLRISLMRYIRKLRHIYSRSLD